MKKSLSRQFIALLLIPVCIILVINFCIIIHLHKSQNEELIQSFFSLLLARFFTTPVFDLPSAISFHLFLTIIPEVTYLPVLSDSCRHLKVIPLHYMLSEVLLLPDHTVLLLSYIPEVDMLHQRDWYKLQDCTVN